MSKKTVVKTVLGLAGAYIAASAAGAIYLSVSSGKRMKEHENGNNMMHSCAISKKTVTVKPDIDHAYINCFNGAAEVVLGELPTKYDMYIELGSMCAAYNIKLPADIIVSIEGTGKGTVVNNNYPETEDTSLPTVHIDINNTKYTSINIASL